MLGLIQRFLAPGAFILCEKNLVTLIVVAAFQAVSISKPRPATVRNRIPAVHLRQPVRPPAAGALIPCDAGDDPPICARILENGAAGRLLLRVSRLLPHTIRFLRQEVRFLELAVRFL